jgi:hypothetical protein
MPTHPTDPAHWLYRLAPREWIRAALGELARAEGAFAARDRRAGMAGCRRAAGMALNGALAATESPDPRYGRTYMDHLLALSEDAAAPEGAQQAARSLVQTPLPGGQIVLLRTRHTEEALLESARTVMAHAMALVLRAESAPPEESGGGEAD